MIHLNIYISWNFQINNLAHLINICEHNNLSQDTPTSATRPIFSAKQVQQIPINSPICQKHNTGY